MRINQIKIGDQVVTNPNVDATIYEVVEIQYGGDVRIQEMVRNASSIHPRPRPVWIDCSALQYASIDQQYFQETRA
jgi:hypothetical protein